MGARSREPTKNQLGASLRQAARNGDFKAAEALLKRGADPNATDRKFRLTALHHAAAAGRADVCQLLVNAGAIVDAADAEGNTPLRLAAGRILAGPAIANSRIREAAAAAACAVLLEAGADPRAADSRLETPMHAAADAGRVSILKMLIKRGADANAKNVSGSTPLHFAASGKRDPEANGCRALLEAGAHPNERNREGMTPLHYAASSPWMSSAISALRQAGADLMARDGDGETPLHVAASFGLLDACRRLIEEGADLLAMDSRGLTPRDLAAREQSQSCRETAEMLSAEMLRLEMMARIPEATSKKTKGADGSKDGF